MTRGSPNSYELNCVPLNSYVEALAYHNVTVFGERIFKEILKVWMGAYFRNTDVLIKREQDTKRYPSLYCTCIQRKGQVRTQRERYHLQVREKCLPRNQPYCLPDLGLLVSKTIKTCLFKPPYLQYSIMATQADKHNTFLESNLGISMKHLKSFTLSELTIPPLET